MSLFTLKVILVIAASLLRFLIAFTSRISLLVIAPGFPFNTIVFSSAGSSTSCYTLTLKIEVLVSLRHSLKWRSIFYCIRCALQLINRCFSLNEILLPLGIEDLYAGNVLNFETWCTTDWTNFVGTSLSLIQALNMNSSVIVNFIKIKSRSWTASASPEGAYMKAIWGILVRVWTDPLILLRCICSRLCPYNIIAIYIAGISGHFILIKTASLLGFLIVLSVYCEWC